MIAVILPIHDPRHWPTVLACYLKQTHTDRCLIIVANGFDEYLPGFELALGVYQTKEMLGVSRACNVGMNIARSKNIEQFARWDCDDLYLPEDTAERVKGLAQSRVVGRSEYPYVDVATGEVVIVGEGTAGKSGYVALTGGTLAGYVADAVPFDPKLPVAEDAAWVIEMRVRYRILPLSLPPPHTYWKQNHGSGHTHAITFQQHKEISACL